MHTHLLTHLWIFSRYVLGWVFTLLVSVLTCILCFTVGPKLAWLICAKPWGRGAMWILGVKCHLEGEENLRGPAVFICNHASIVDIILLPAILPRTNRFVAKKELQRIPFWGWAFAASGAVMIDRKNPRGAIQAIREGLERLPEGWSVVVFPEGTRTSDGKLQQFKKGAFHIAREAGLPVVPIGIAGSRDIAPKGAAVLRGGHIYACVGEPISSASWAHEDLDDVVTRVRHVTQRCVEDAEKGLAVVKEVYGAGGGRKVSSQQAQAST